MFFLRFIVLAFLVAYGWSMGQFPAQELNAFGKVVALTPFVTIPALYLLPTFEAHLREHPNFGAISIVNVLLGWTVIGWVVAVVWAYKKPEIAAPGGETQPAPTPAPTQPERALKACPFCAEDVLAAAIKCKHCGSDLLIAEEVSTTKS